MTDVTVYFKTSGSMGSEYEVDRLTGPADLIDKIIEEIVSNEVEETVPYLENNGIKVKVVASSADDNPGYLVVPEYEYDIDQKKLYKNWSADSVEMTREEEAMRLAIELDEFCYYVDFFDYCDAIEEREIFVKGLQYYFLNCGGNTLGIENWLSSILVDEDTDCAIIAKAFIDRIEAFTGINWSAEMRTESVLAVDGDFVELLKEVAKSEEWFVHVESGGCFNFSKFSPAGHDFNFYVRGNSIDEVVENLKKYYKNADVSELTYMWLDGSGHGTNGAPYDMRDVYNDMEASVEDIKILVEVLEVELLNEKIDKGKGER